MFPYDQPILAADIDQTFSFMQCKYPHVASHPFLVLISELCFLCANLLRFRFFTFSCLKTLMIQMSIVVELSFVNYRESFKFFHHC